MRYAYTSNITRVFASFVDHIGDFFFLFVPKNRNIGISPRRILIIKLDHLGDCFLLTPIFGYLKEKFPNADIDVLCQKSCEPIFKHNSNIHNIFTFNYWRFHRGNNPDNFFDLLSFIKKNRKKYDLIIDARGEPMAALTSFLLGAKHRIGFEKEEVGDFFYTKKIKWSREESEWKKYIHILEFFNIPTNGWYPKIFLTTEENKVVSAFLPNRSFLVAGIGAGAEYKRYPTRNFIDVFAEIKKKKEYSIIILGDLGEKELGDEFASGLKSDVKNYIGITDIRISYGIISHAAGFVGNDSVLAHFSGSFDIPTIELMSCINNPRRWGALGKKTKVIVGRDPSHECPVGSCGICPHMLAISENDILMSIEIKL